jgi:hypothetical protein
MKFACSWTTCSLDQVCSKSTGDYQKNWMQTFKFVQPRAALSAVCEFRSVMMKGGFHKRRFVIRTRNTSFGARFLCLSPVSINMAQTVGPVFIDRCLNVGFHILPQTTPCSLVNRHFVIVGKPERIGPQLSGKFDELELRISALATASPTAKTNG